MNANLVIPFGVGKFFYFKNQVILQNVTIVVLESYIEVYFSLSGRRMCMGKQLVRMELFLLMSNLLHQFKFTFPPNSKPSMEANKNVISSPQKFQIRALRRF